MPKPQPGDNFFWQVPRKSGRRKGQIFFGTTEPYLQEAEVEITLQDLLDFMKEKGIDPAKVRLEGPLLLWAEN